VSCAGIARQLEEILQRPDVYAHLWHFLDRPVDDQILSDVYDGQVFRGAQQRPKQNDPAATWFTRIGEYELALGFFIDAFQAFKDSQYSVTPAYITILNLPRDVRFLPQNIVLALVIPGMFVLISSR
jgi:hypothetical protein